MKKTALASLAILFFILANPFTALCQDPSIDRWIDEGFETNIYTPAKVGIIKTAESSSTLEELTRFRLSDAGFDYLGIKNATSVDGKFIPWIFGYNQSDSRVSLFISGVTSTSNDVVGGDALIQFDARSYSDANTYSGGGPIVNRPLFNWKSYITTYMTMSANGSLGIGTNSPQSQLHTTGSVRFTGLPNASASNLVMADASGVLSRSAVPTNTQLMFVSTSAIADNTLMKVNSGNTLVSSQFIDNGINIGIGGLPTANGKVTVYGTLHLMSDERKKTNIVRMENALDKIEQLNGYYYDWKDQVGDTQVGLLAQEVEKVLPQAVAENQEGTKFLNYEGIIPVLTEAIKEQQKLIVAQREELNNLKKEVEILKKKK